MSDSTVMFYKYFDDCYNDYNYYYSDNHKTVAKISIDHISIITGMDGNVYEFDARHEYAELDGKHKFTVEISNNVYEVTAFYDFDQNNTILPYKINDYMYSEVCRSLYNHCSRYFSDHMYDLDSCTSDLSDIIIKKFDKDHEEFVECSPEECYEEFRQCIHKWWKEIPRSDDEDEHQNCCH